MVNNAHVETPLTAQGAPPSSQADEGTERSRDAFAGRVPAPCWSPGGVVAFGEAEARETVILGLVR
jgi:hypothetical protein